MARLTARIAGATCAASLLFTPAAGDVGAWAPEITSETWINSKPLRAADLRGKVVLVEFWTFGCQNCRNVEPHIKQWHSAYGDKGMVVVGVHSPEFKHEADIGSVRRYIGQNGIRYAVAIDNDFTNWNHYGNRYWPAVYLIDRKGIIRHVKIGEGEYERTEGLIRDLIAEELPPE